MSVRLQVAQPADGLIEGTAPPLVPPGMYAGQFLHHETALLFRHAPKVFLHFRLVDMGPHNGKLLWRPYNVRELIGRVGRGGRFKVSRRSDLVRELAAISGQRFRLDRISFDSMRHILVRLRVRVVQRDQRQRQIPEPLRYSIVAELIGVETGKCDL